MATLTYIQAHADGTRITMRRSVPQGRKPSGLGRPKLYRLFAEDVEILAIMEEKLGCMYNENEIVRTAVHTAIETIYTEFLKQ